MHGERIVFWKTLVAISAVVPPLIEDDRCVHAIKNSMIDHTLTIVVYL